MNNPNLSNLENTMKALKLQLEQETHKLQAKDAEAKALLEENTRMTRQIETNKQLHAKLENEMRVIKSDQEKIHREVTKTSADYTQILKNFKDIKLK